MPKKAKKSAVKKIARQKSLPGMSDRKVAAIENLALDYAEIRDQRMELSKQEVELKTKLIDLMHAQKRKTYQRGNINIELVVEAEKIKVRVKSVEDEAPPEEEETPDEPDTSEDVEEEEETEEPEFDEEAEEEQAKA